MTLSKYAFKGIKYISILICSLLIFAILNSSFASDTLKQIVLGQTYLDFAESLSEETINDLKFRTIKPYYNEPLLKSKRFATAIEGKEFNFDGVIDKINYFLKMSSDQDSPRYYYVKSLFYYLKDNYTEAIKYSEKSVSKTNYKYYLFLGKLYEHELMNTKAIKMYEKAIDIEPKFKGENLRRIGDIYWNSRDFNNALQYYYYATEYNDKIAIPFRAYSYNNLCEKMADLNAKSKSISFLKGIEVSLALYCEKRDMNKSYFVDSKYMKYSREQIDRVVDLGANYADKGKYEFDNGDFGGAEISFKSAVNLSGYYWGDLALIELKLKKITELNKLIKKYIENKQAGIKMNVFDISKTVYDYKIYSIMMDLNRDNYYRNAELIILSAPDSKIAMHEIEKHFSKNDYDYNKLVLLNHKYEDLYQYFESKGYDMLNSSRSIEKTKILLSKMNIIDKSKIDIEEIENLLKTL